MFKPQSGWVQEYSSLPRTRKREICSYFIYEDTRGLKASIHCFQFVTYIMSAIKTIVFFMELMQEGRDTVNIVNITYLYFRVWADI